MTSVRDTSAPRSHGNARPSLSPSGTPAKTATWLWLAHRA